MEAGGAAEIRARTLAELEGMIADVVGEDYLLDLVITADTTFNGDLELESIEVVLLAERLLQRYGDRVDLLALIGGLSLDEIIGLTVGQVADHVAVALAAPDERQAALQPAAAHG